MLRKYRMDDCGISGCHQLWFGRIYSPGHPGIRGNERAESLASKTHSTMLLWMGRAKIMRGMNGSLVSDETVIVKTVQLRLHERGNWVWDESRWPQTTRLRLLEWEIKYETSRGDKYRILFIAVKFYAFGKRGKKGTGEAGGGCFFWCFLKMQFFVVDVFSLCFSILQFSTQKFYTFCVCSDHFKIRILIRI